MDRGITLLAHQYKHNLKNSSEPQTSFSLLGSNATKVIDFLLFPRNSKIHFARGVEGTFTKC